MKRKLIVRIMIIAAVVGTAAYLYVRWKGERPATTLDINGNIEAHESVVGFKVQGRLAELPVEEGQEVKAGELLARLDQNDYRQQVDIDEASAKTREKELKLALAGSRIQDKKSAEQAMLDAKADLELKKLDFKRNQALFEKDEVSAQVRDTADTKIAVDRANVLSARQALGLSRIRLGYTDLTAPVSGVVEVRQAELGEVMAPGSPVVTITDLDHLWMRGYISETDLGRVRLGQAAMVKTDTYPGKLYRGRVSFISSTSEFTPKSVETHKERVTLVYRIKIELDNPNHELKPGMPADATIEAVSAN
jgi:HlyD family secretion protein